jgi:hypothetical protein
MGVNDWMANAERDPWVMANRIDFFLFDPWYLHDVAAIRP